MKRRLSALLLALLPLFLSACAYAPGAATPASVPDGELAVHFIDVGQADSALLLCGGQAMLIDGGNAQDSSRVVSYLEDQGVDTLDYVVCTHAHEDHVGGLSGPLNTCAAAQVFSPRPRIRFQGLPGFCPVHRSPRPYARRTLPRRDLFPGRRCGDGSGAPAGL